MKFKVFFFFLFFLLLFSQKALAVEAVNPVTDRLYTGQIKDDTGLYYYNARYYDPQLGIFTSADRAQGPNRYTYVGGNPIMRNDPSGNTEATDAGGAGIKDYDWLANQSTDYWGGGLAGEFKKKRMLLNIGFGLNTESGAEFISFVMQKEAEAKGNLMQNMGAAMSLHSMANAAALASIPSNRTDSYINDILYGARDTSDITHDLPVRYGNKVVWPSVRSLADYTEITQATTRVETVPKLINAIAYYHWREGTGGLIILTNDTTSSSVWHERGHIAAYNSGLFDRQSLAISQGNINLNGSAGISSQKNNSNFLT